MCASIHKKILLFSAVYLKELQLKMSTGKGSICLSENEDKIISLPNPTIRLWFPTPVESFVTVSITLQRNTDTRIWTLVICTTSAYKFSPSAVFIVL